MGKGNEKRSSSTGIAKDTAHQDDLPDGVGGRQACPPTSPQGGGYLNICTTQNFGATVPPKKRDPRLNELRQIGLQHVWVSVAEGIGVDNMLRAWQILDGDHVSIGDDGRLLIPLRRYSAYLRFQRNRYIEALLDLGFTTAAIQERLAKQIGDKLSKRHISRLTRKTSG